MRPLLLFGVLYVFFTQIAHVNNGKAPGGNFYGAQLLGSIVLFTFFAEATTGAVRSVVDRENLVRKIQFPRLVIPLSVVLLRDVQPRPEPDRRDRSSRSLGRDADARAGSSCR